MLSELSKICARLEVKPYARLCKLKCQGLILKARREDNRVVCS